MDTGHPVGRWVSENLGYVGAGLAYFVAGFHLFHPDRGFPRLLLLLSAGSPSLLVQDPRPLAFVLSALAILLGVQLAIVDRDRPWMYPLGIVVVEAYFLGYFAWHLTGHGGFLPGREPLYHGLTPVEAVVAHLVDNPLVAGLKLAELALVVVLGVLYRRKL